MFAIETLTKHEEEYIQLHLHRDENIKLIYCPATLFSATVPESMSKGVSALETTNLLSVSERLQHLYYV